MKMDNLTQYSFKETLKNEALKYNFNITDEQLTMFENYKNLLLEWNKKINLTAITDEYEIILKHFIDCLECTKYINENENIIDVGTGAGFPGIVIAIYLNNKVKITLVDALNKRILFLEEVVKKLGLKNINIIHGRAEELAHKTEYREIYDVVVSRAVANLTTLLEFDVGFLKVNGRCLFLKGDNVKEEINNAKNALKILKCDIENIYNYNYELNKEIYLRNILLIVKKYNLSSKYPRNFGKIKKSPL